MIVRKLTDSHDMVFGRGMAGYLTGEEAVKQNVKTRILLLKGEWFLDVDAGVPWLQEIMVKPAQLQLTEDLIKAEILETVGVKEINSFDLTFDHNNRNVNMTITTTFTDEIIAVSA